MKQIAIKNYRSIIDSGIIDLLPITVVVGRNSAGKSSFLRTFPLIKQTLERRISDSILWYGDYVDFGDFQHAVSKSNNSEAIEISFSLKVNPRRYRYMYIKNGTNVDYTAIVTISVREKYFEKITINIYDQIIELKMSGDGRINNILVNSDDTIIKSDKLHWFRETGDLLPSIYEKRDSDDEGKVYISRFNYRAIIKKCRYLIYGTKLKKDGYELPFNDDEIGIALGTAEDILKILKKVNKEKFAKSLTKHQRFMKINNYIIASKLPSIFDDINHAISQEMKQTHYVKPIRAVVDRYYRVQGISIDKLDADGSNLPMILYNMSDSDLKKFEEWSDDKFGVLFSVTRGVGHVSLIVKDGEEETNVADTGYGYSQMLPIVVLLWMLHNSNQSSNWEKVSKTIVMEQPELHLHPAYQAKMIDVFVNVIKEAFDKGIDMKIVFETHSESMINRLGRLIASKKLDSQWVNILVFDKDKDITSINSKKFNEKGLLTGWPIGFFATDEVR